MKSSWPCTRTRTCWTRAAAASAAAEISRQLKDTPGVRDVLSLAEVDEVLDKVASAVGMLQSSDVPENGIVDSTERAGQAVPETVRGLHARPRRSHGGRDLHAGAAGVPGVTREQTVNELREKIQRLAGRHGRRRTGDGRRWISLCRRGRPATGLDVHHLAVGGPADLFPQPAVDGAGVAVVQVALLATRALLVVSGLRLSMVSSMLTAIVTVVGVATVMHVIVRFREAPRAGLSPHESFLLTAALAGSSRVLGHHDRRRWVLLVAGRQRGAGAGLRPDDGHGLAVGAGQRDPVRSRPDVDRSPRCESSARPGSIACSASS